MAAKKTSKSNGVENDQRVLVDREEYSALLALKDRYEEHVVADAKAANRNHDLLITCNAQATRLSEIDLTMHHLERVNELQRVFIDLLRADHPAVASLEDLSKFWWNWTVTTENAVKNDPRQRTEIAKVEPDLFRSWKIWTRDADRMSRSFALAGTRAEVEAQQPASQAVLQDRVVGQLRDQNTVLVSRVRELEGQVDAYKHAHKNKQPG
jgi:hypothetical protein